MNYPKRPDTPKPTICAVAIWSRPFLADDRSGRDCAQWPVPSTNGRHPNVIGIINLPQTAAVQCQHQNESLRSPWPRSRRISSCML